MSVQLWKNIYMSVYKHCNCHNNLFVTVYKNTKINNEMYMNLATQIVPLDISIYLLFGNEMVIIIDYIIHSWKVLPVS